MTFAEAIDSLKAEPALSPQERLVVIYLVQGRTYVDVAVVMQISPRTAKQYGARARAKLGCRSSREVIQLVAERIMTSHLDDCTN